MYDSFITIAIVIIIFASYFMNRKNTKIVLIALAIHILVILMWILGASHFGGDSPNKPYSNLDNILSQTYFIIALLLSVVNVILLIRNRINWEKTHPDLLWVIEVMVIAVLSYISIAFPTILFFWFIFFPVTIIVGIISLIVNMILNRKEKIKTSTNDIVKTNESFSPISGWKY